jgi:hypothetical protein
LRVSSPVVSPEVVLKSWKIVLCVVGALVFWWGPVFGSEVSGVAAGKEYYPPSKKCVKRQKGFCIRYRIFPTDCELTIKKKDGSVSVGSKFSG